MMVDLRSDTLTQPTAAMRAAMAEAVVGDDVFGEDPEINALQQEAAALVGQPAGLFVPSGTMGNLLAIMAWTRPGDEALCGQGAHTLLYEGAGAAALAGVQMVAIGQDGHFTPDELESAIHVVDAGQHVAPTTLVLIENTHNRAGGVILPVDRFSALAETARRRGVRVHIDGARLFNAAVASGRPASDWGSQADSVTFCLSKGLGAPVGSVLCGPEDFIARAHRARKRLGGGMRQVGILAAAGRYALSHHIERLAEDHRRARLLAEALSEMPGVVLDPASVQTNIIYFDLAPSALSAQALVQAVSPTVRLGAYGERRLRAVLHLDIDDAGLEQAISAFDRALRSA